MDFISLFILIPLKLTQCSQGCVVKISLLHRLQVQTFPDATPPIGQIHTFSKMAVTFEPLRDFDALWDLERSQSL